MRNRLAHGDMWRKRQPNDSKLSDQRDQQNSERDQHPRSGLAHLARGHLWNGNVEHDAGQYEQRESYGGDQLTVSCQD